MMTSMQGACGLPCFGTSPSQAPSSKRCLLTFVGETKISIGACCNIRGLSLNRPCFYPNRNIRPITQSRMCLNPGRQASRRPAPITRHTLGPWFGSVEKQEQLKFRMHMRTRTVSQYKAVSPDGCSGIAIVDCQINLIPMFLILNDFIFPCMHPDQKIVKQDQVQSGQQRALRLLWHGFSKSIILAFNTSRTIRETVAKLVNNQLSTLSGVPIRQSPDITPALISG